MTDIRIPNLSLVVLIGPSGSGKSTFAAKHFKRTEGVGRVVCEGKHMGSRAIVVACRDADAARDRFGIKSGETGTCYTRPGRPTSCF